MKTSSYMTILGVILVLSGSAVSGRDIRASEPRCCDDLVQHGFQQTNGDYGGCAAAKIGSRCETAMSWLESKETCENLGARLCYFDEVESRVLKGLGCSSDDDGDALTWTDERCIYDFDTGDDGYLAYNEDGDEQYCLSKANGKAQLACCADPCTSSSSSSSIQEPRIPKAKSCSDLKKDFPFQHLGDHAVCATISVEKHDGEWVCGGDEPWESAQSKCEAIGARLCTGDEFLQAQDHDSDNVTLGCDLKDALMWTSERCVSDWVTGENGYLAAGATGGEYLACLPKKDGKAKMACCADSETGSSRRDSKRSKHIS